MPHHLITRETKIQRTPRVIKAESLFDVPPTENATQKWDVNLTLPKEWNIGVIVGPSGAGKTTIATEIFGPDAITTQKWAKQKSILDNFPDKLTFDEIVETLTKIGLGSPPTWLQPHHTLSNGEQFRASTALAILTAPKNKPIIIDEFTSVIDRTVAKTASQATAKLIRKTNKQIVLITCHYDIIPWLQPDWTYQPHTNELARGCLQQRPPIELTIHHAPKQLWEAFSRHHYLSTNLHPGSTTYAAYINDTTPIAYCATLTQPHPKNRKLRRVHRIVTLPEYQGLGAAHYLLQIVAQHEHQTLGKTLTISTAHPAFAKSLNRSENWKYQGRNRIRNRAISNKAVEQIARKQRDARLLQVHRFKWHPTT